MYVDQGHMSGSHIIGTIYMCSLQVSMVSVSSITDTDNAAIWC